MANLLKQFRSLLPSSSLLIGEVAAVNGDEIRIVLEDGSIHIARGSATVGDKVYFRSGGAIEGQAPDLTATVIDI